MRRIFIFFLTLLFTVSLYSQTRLHTIDGLKVAESEDLRLIMKTILDSNYYWHSGFIDDFIWGNNRGFYIDKRTNIVVYTSYQFKVDKPIHIVDTTRKVLKISECNTNKLSTLLDLAVSTSSPQNDYSQNISSTYYFVNRTDIAEIWCPTSDSPQSELVKVCQNVCRACEEKDESYIDSIESQILHLTSTYKNLLNYDFNYYPSERFMTIGSLDSYVYVATDFDTEIDESNLPAHKALLEKIARFLVENTDGHVNCNISVRSSMKEKDYHVTDVEDIIIGHEDFNQEKLMPIFNKILKKNQIIE